MWVLVPPKWTLVNGCKWKRGSPVSGEQTNLTKDPIAVANMMTLNGATRAVVGAVGKSLHSPCLRAAGGEEGYVMGCAEKYADVALHTFTQQVV